MYSDCRERLSRYCHSIRADPKYNAESIAEANGRMGRMEFMIGRVQELHARTWLTDNSALREHFAYLQYNPRLAVPAHAQYMNDLLESRKKTQPCTLYGMEIQVLTEAFYWCAFRVRSVIRRIPGLATFDCPGIRNVRNNLLEHPEGSDSQVLGESFGFGGEHGPVVKSVRRQDQIDVHPDRGLYLNAQEFADRLLSMLARQSRNQNNQSA